MCQFTNTTGNKFESSRLLLNKMNTHYTGIEISLRYSKFSILLQIKYSSVNIVKLFLWKSYSSSCIGLKIQVSFLNVVSLPGKCIFPHSNNHGANLLSYFIESRFSYRPLNLPRSLARTLTRTWHVSRDRSACTRAACTRATTPHIRWENWKTLLP